MSAACLPIYKPRGMRSAELVTLVKKQFAINKIGHTGSLDSFAEGLMLLLINEATALSSICMAQRKSYRALIGFGSTTDTLDPYGVRSYSDVYPSVYQVMKAVQAERGHCFQRPPRFSALKINGKRYSDLARSNILLRPSLRRIHIYDAVPVHVQRTRAEIAITVSKGAYIRSYAQSLADYWGGLAVLDALRRDSIGGVYYTDAHTLSYIRNHAWQGTKLFKPLSWLFERLTTKRLFLNESGRQAILQGKQVSQHELIGLLESFQDGIQQRSNEKNASNSEYIATSQDAGVYALIRIRNRTIRYHLLDTFDTKQYPSERDKE